MSLVGGDRQVVATDALWTACADNLRAQVSDPVWMSCFEELRPIGADDNRLVLAVPNGLVKERIEGRYLDLVRNALTDVTGATWEVALEVRTADRDTGSGEAAPVPAAVPDQGRARTTPTVPGRSEVDLLLSPGYTFEAFVIGASNRFAHAAALSVAETPARSYNPLLIYGASGLGKTHLLHAIAHYVRQNYPTQRAVYVSTETFLNEFVDAIRTSTTSQFKRRYRECDVLLIDDLQFLETREGLQEELFHTFNALHQAGRQIVLSSDRHPRNIATLEDRLRSRFEWGLITDVQPPDIETRLAILRKKAEREQMTPPDDVLEFIASNIKENIRELEGALIRVCAYSSLNRVPLSRELAEKVLSDILSANEPRQITPKLILEATSTMFGFSIDELCGHSRRRPLVTARQIGMYVFRQLTDFSYPAIAREFGGRDHTTVIHAVEKISRLMKERRAIFDQVSELTQAVKSRG